MIILVEGDGDKRALPALIERERAGSTIHCVDMHGKSNMVRKPRGFEDTVRRQYALGGHSFMVLMDADVTFKPYESPDEERRDMRQRAEALERELKAPVRVCWAVIAMESWLIGGIKSRATYCGLQQPGQISRNTETAPENPVQWLKGHLQSGEYSPRVQECLARKIDLQQAKGRNQSMRTFLETIGR